MPLSRTLTRSLLAGCIAAALMSTAHAQSTNTDNAKNKKATELQTVVVTGTRSFDRTEADSMAPIDVLSPQDLKNTGATNLASALRTLLPSLNFPQPSVTDATDATQPAQLRGLSPDQTLVLINGKRQHSTAVLNTNGSLGRGSSPVDLNAIPINAIDHIEVLRDGAAAQYGSDAIAGVINVILKGGAKHGSASITGGQYDTGDGDTWHGGADGGFKLGDGGWVHLSANYMHQDPTNRAGPDPRYPADPTYNTVTFHYGLPQTKAKQAAINLQYDLTPNAQLYAFSLFNKRNVSSQGFFRSLSTYASQYPNAVAQYPGGYLPVENSAIRDDSEVLGVRGKVAGWNYDVSYNTGGNHWKMHTSNTWNYSLGANSPTVFQIGTLTNRENLLNADFSRDVHFPGMDAPVTVAWGLEYRHEKFEIKQGDGASYACGPVLGASGYPSCGGQVFSGYTPNDAGSHSRHNRSIYLDLESDLTNKFSAGLAVRNEHYSDFGGTTSWKASGRYAFNDTVAARATVSTGFRAPSLQQEYYSSTATNFVNTGSGLVPVQIRTFPVDDPAAQALGAQPLKPEKSHNYSFGLVFTPANGLYATLDAYQIDIDNRIILSGNLTGSAVQTYLMSAGFTDVGGGRFFTNAVDTRTRGADLVATYPWYLQSGSTVKFTGGMNYNKTDIRKIANNPPQLGLAGLTLPIIDRQEQGRITVGTPRTKTFVGADWSVNHWTFHSQATRYGTWTSRGSSASSDQTFSAKVLLDLSVSYAQSGWTFTLGGNNVTNVYPEKNDANNNYHGILTYPLTSPYGFSGAYYYGSVAYDW
ncbi:MULTISPECIES: TonB-dependent receptor [Oleiagrimonas]|jgi:iron complex outermembrane recepter protein|uniref:TonB-dependent receptor n=2 Tax=Oleiagrimonas citrea TaxID=1665687 RepID=A0A846ZPQ0_9GAMM|nr:MULTISPECIES: TonB-dependent receptor [Oleiagrimonas]NKZ39560.1 TonB-dependent receptor [Oleiagrimonas citrea]RAP59478.1 ligand-gated channel [Oleiagrimonas sp. MCCC 1A03011]